MTDRQRTKAKQRQRYGGLTMPDLFDDPPESMSHDTNYATRKALQWIESDPVLDETCLVLARRRRRAWRISQAPSSRTEAEILANDLRSVVIREAVRFESTGLFFELFLGGAREICWTDLAKYFLSKSQKRR